jgi:very-short-patch-repair endonuclease
MISVIDEHPLLPHFLYLKMGGAGRGQNYPMRKAKRSTPSMLHRAWELRNEPTPAEARLWAYLRALGEENIHFRRQHAIGPYIVDFCAPSRKLIVEVDGSQHLDQEEYDAERTAFLAAKGYRLLRFWNADVMNKINEVMGVIMDAMMNK